MYIYLIKYNDNIIAAANNDETASAVIVSYMFKNKDMKADLFEKEAVRYFDEQEVIQEENDEV